MKRREFVKTTSLIALPVLLKSCDWISTDQDFEVEVMSDAKTGHLVSKSLSFATQEIPAVETLIVGGGIAGMSAACRLKNSDFLLCELSDDLGGTSSASTFNHSVFSQGAHYDLAYPENYGEEVLKLFEELDIIRFQPWQQAWSFKDEQHLIKHRRKNHCYDHGTHRQDVLQEGDLKNQFLQIMAPYQGKMVLPSRLIQQEFHHLNNISFVDFLKEKMPLSDDFIRGLDYHMKDDYGAGVEKVSALAGIHYFMCRPYYNEIVELFSPPEGNYYFIKKMKTHVGEERLLTRHLVSSIKETTDGFEVRIVDVKNQVTKILQTRKVIYAGQKHALKYIYPQGYDLFKETDYAPWMIVNVVTDNQLPTPGYWQNEMLTDDEAFLGFVDSNTQHTPASEYRVLTGYYCLPPASRNDLINAEKNKQKIAETTIQQMSNYFGQNIDAHVKKVYIKAMGHAMPIPSPGYLFNDKNAQRTNKDIAYAGVDTGRLPLLYEAVDSGLKAAELVLGQE